MSQFSYSQLFLSSAAKSVLLGFDLDWEFLFPTPTPQEADLIPPLESHQVSRNGWIESVALVHFFKMNKSFYWTTH